MGSVPGKPQRVIGRYALYTALSSGGMATVHLARLQGPVGFSRTVAIKRLHEQYASDPEFVASFLDEANLAARIRHPNVVPTLDVVATEGQLFLVMEYVQGESLSRLLRGSIARSELVPPRIAVGILVGLLNGLHAAHEANNERGAPLHIVHRDVSPQNVMVGIDGVARVVDFGIAKAVGRLQSTREGQLKGKLAYMAAEQIQGEKVDRRTDLYAASVVAWETLTATRLFSADNDAALLSKVLAGASKPPSAIVPDVAPLDEIVMRGLRRDPAERWQTARDMALALEEALPPATPNQIGAWVERVAADMLSARATLVGEIESGDLSGDRISNVLAEIRKSGPDSSAESQPQTSTTATDRSLSLTTPAGVPSRGARRSYVWVAAVAAAVAALSAVLLLRTRHDTPVTPATTATPQTPPPPSVNIPPPPLQVSASSAPVPVAAPSATSTASSPAKVTAAAATPVAPRPAAVHPPAPSSKVDCSNPYSYDAMGRKIYKKECL